ncbi:bifunctional 2-polyprenyl-6-hydroxyphenol methylase/3-demethylubiquinol 3-O-methyltransferase UbiG [Nocardioides sp. LS1]|uniref:class I SAM-dependent methyltransferase n=1 Tax=Nocardioides sp. LS1 TaxID=1027620 RepID=UPI000F61B169|nr:class I SAM-dependent methyltransferase [Nocardioides sp. LS1]GCD89886.1 hypothetical protein NLS1_18920 [Nocardioides sp. LS1]
MTHEFDRAYWEKHWQEAGSGGAIPPNPWLVAETADLAPGTALDAGCGEGAEAVWLAGQGWRVTAADISAEVLARAAARAGDTGAGIDWVEADLGTWEPDTAYDLVTTHYAHPAIPQLAFYARIAEWVAPGGTLLVVGHLASAEAGHGHGHGHQPPTEATATAERVAALLDADRWEVVTAGEHIRTLTDRGSGAATLHDVVVRARRR